MGFKKSNFSKRNYYNIGDMNTTITIQKRYESPNTTDNIYEINEFLDLFKVNCYWKTLKSELVSYDEDGSYMAETIKTVKNVLIVFPFRKGIDCECYVVCDNIRYKIIEVENIDNRNMYLKCYLMSMGNVEIEGNKLI